MINLLFTTFPFSFFPPFSFRFYIETRFGNSAGAYLEGGQSKVCELDKISRQGGINPGN